MAYLEHSLLCGDGFAFAQIIGVVLVCQRLLSRASTCAPGPLLHWQHVESCRMLSDALFQT